LQSQLQPAETPVAATFAFLFHSQRSDRSSLPSSANANGRASWLALATVQITTFLDSYPQVTAWLFTTVHADVRLLFIPRFSPALSTVPDGGLRGWDLHRSRFCRARRNMKSTVTSTACPRARRATSRNQQSKQHRLDTQSVPLAMQSWVLNVIVPALMKSYRNSRELQSGATRA
jgi:hypothetical protein